MTEMFLDLMQVPSAPDEKRRDIHEFLGEDGTVFTSTRLSARLIA